MCPRHHPQIRIQNVPTPSPTDPDTECAHAITHRSGYRMCPRHHPQIRIQNVPTPSPNRSGNRRLQQLLERRQDLVRGWALLRIHIHTSVTNQYYVHFPSNNVVSPPSSRTSIHQAVNTVIDSSPFVQSGKRPHLLPDVGRYLRDFSCKILVRVSSIRVVDTYTPNCATQTQYIRSIRITFYNFHRQLERIHIFKRRRQSQQFIHNHSKRINCVEADCEPFSKTCLSFFGNNDSYGSLMLSSYFSVHAFFRFVQVQISALTISSEGVTFVSFTRSKDFRGNVGWGSYPPERQKSRHATAQPMIKMA